MSRSRIFGFSARKARISAGVGRVVLLMGAAFIEMRCVIPSCCSNRWIFLVEQGFDRDFAVCYLDFITHISLCTQYRSRKVMLILCPAAS